MIWPRRGLRLAEIKDMGFVRVLTDGLVNADQLIERIDALPIPIDQVRLVRGRVNRLVATQLRG